MGDELEMTEVELDWLDRKLREEASYIDDAGFTAAVVQKLPAQRTSRSLRAAILIGAAVVASIVTYFLSGSGRFIYEAFAQASLFSPATILIASVAIGLLLTGVAAFAAVKRSEAS